MKFSYSVIKGFAPKLKNKNELIDALAMHSFETEDGSADVLEVSVPPNRFSDAASHYGLAREAAAIFNIEVKEPPLRELGQSGTKDFEVKVEENNLCPRYTAAYFENIKVAPSPKWLAEALKNCGLRPISNIVDIMNYVMLETGQPLHAFDADKLAKKTIIVRKARDKEVIVSIDNVRYELSKDALLIADPEKPLAIAGIKGGAGSEVTSETKRIIVEAANFDSVSVYKTSRALKLATDASVRFSHDLAPALAKFGLSRAARLLEEVAGAQFKSWFDSETKPEGRHFIKLDLAKLNSLAGHEFKAEEAAGYLSRLGFQKAVANEWTAPELRPDIYTHEDLAEEVIRLYGVNDLKPAPPQVALRPSEEREMLVLKDRLRKFLVGVGLDEVYNNSFVAEADLALGDFWQNEPQALTNPLSAEFAFLRPNLAINLLKNIADNFRFAKAVRIFEIGHIFGALGRGKINERAVLGLALGEKNKETFFELKGIVAELLESFGLTDFTFIDWPKPLSELKAGLKIEVDSQTIGYLAHFKEGLSVAELDIAALLTQVEDEYSFEPLPKYPAVERDISVFVSADERIGDIILAIEKMNPSLIEDVALIDEYEDPKRERTQSITLRIVFQAEDRTLTNEEVDKEMRRITNYLQRKYKTQVR